MHDEGEELVEWILSGISDYWRKKVKDDNSFEEWKKDINWCKIRQKVEKKLKLGLSDAQT